RSPPFAGWHAPGRPRPHGRLLAAALDALEADGLAAMKRTRSVLRSLDRLDPVNEAVVRLGMRLDHAVGDAASLHRRYRQLCDRLEHEFAALPSEDTRALFHALVGHGVSAPPGPPPAQPPTAAPPTAALPGGDDLVPLVVVAPLQTGGDDASLVSLAAFCADDIR